ncbi:diaminopimelate epimerase [Clostridium sp. Sa3CUN1]|uniref:Diaminopimelate epimerase n=1 Tax=Clostridium gallinarum TaxID=2762246 RepID=A0ABR8PZP3_9CLOT|nr:diaminopimelate epimerase [Clostridium gallinarum]MBD7913628.1 diaminopimelate epimerase [Clostridium gallinarum]
MNFIKMQALGNDFILIDDSDEKIIENEIQIAKKVCNRKFGVGADGLVIVRESNYGHKKMIIINSDGSRANMCGNAIRCFAKYLYEIEFIKGNKLLIETGDGIKEVELYLKNNKVDLIKVKMGKVSFKGEDIPLKLKEELINEEILINNKLYKITSLLIGVPHTILINNNNEYTIDDGKIIEKHDLFLEGTNVNIVKIIDKGNIEVKTWERGAGATLACGTGCCASVATLNKFGLANNKVKVKTLGGNLEVNIINEEIYMIGGAEFICKGELLF